MANLIISVGDIKTRMIDARFARQPSTVLTAWNKVRVAVRLRISDSGSAIAGTPRLALGICSGSTNIIGDATTDHWVGMATSAAPMSRSTSPTRYSGGVSASKRVGATWTDNAIGSAVIIPVFLGSLLFVDITKGSPNFTIDAWGRSVAGATYDATNADFLAQYMQASPSLSEHGSIGATTAVAVDEGTDGTLNHINIGWNNQLPYVDLAEIALVKLS